MATILIVEDDALLLDALSGQLTQQGWDVLTASSVPQARTALQAQAVDGVILDLGLPGGDGMDVLVWARKHITGLPVLILTARDGIEDRVRGLNSGADDFAFTPTPASARPAGLLKSGFFSSNRSGESAKGGDDIYRFEQRVPPLKPVKVDTMPAKVAAYKMILEGYVLEKIYEAPDDPNSKVLGRKPLEGAAVKAEFGAKKQMFSVAADGYFRLELTDNMDYTFYATQNGYLANSTKFSTRGIAKDPASPVQTFEVEIVLDKIFRDREIVLENIYYDYDKWDIRPDAEPTLNRLAEVLRQNPGVRIQLGSHTDCRGNDSYNQELSQRRAQSAVNYLISNGIVSDRLTAMGYGERQPAAPCACARCTEAEHQTNRRTTFKIVE